MYTDQDNEDKTLPTLTNTRVYVGHLNYRTTWQQLKDHMRKCGNVRYVNILRNRNDESKGCGIAEYETPEEAARAIAELSDTELDGFNIFVREDREEQGFSNKVRRTNDFEEGCKIFVKNLPFEVGWKTLKSDFESVGKVVRADVLENQKGYSVGSGTVLYENAEDAQKAIDLYNGTDYKGRIISVRLYSKERV